MSNQSGTVKMSVNMFLDRIYEEHGELTPEIIINLARAVELDAYRTINILCNYINICRKVEKGEDLALICQLHEENEKLKNKCEQYADDYKTLSHNRELLYSQLSEAKIANEELNRKYETLKSKLEHNRNLEYLDRIFHGTGA